MYLIDFVEDLDAMQGYHKQLDDLIDDVETITGNFGIIFVEFKPFVILYI